MNSYQHIFSEQHSISFITPVPLGGKNPMVFTLIILYIYSVTD